MASRAPIHCPNCHTQYEPHAPSCSRCGRVKDQEGDATEIVAPVPPPPFRPLALPRVARPPKAARTRARDNTHFPFWIYPVGAVIFICSVGRLFARKGPVPPPVPPAAYKPSRQELARRKKQKADDARFFAEKAKKDNAEVAAYLGQSSLPNDAEEQARKNQEYAARQAAARQAAARATPEPTRTWDGIVR